MHRQPLRIAAISALAIHVAACASTPAAAPKASPAATNVLPSVQSQMAIPPATSIPQEIKQAQSLRAQGRLQDAARILAQLVLAAPDNGQVVGEYGKTLVQMNRPDDAVAFLKRAIELRGDDRTLYSALGVAYDQMDDRKNAKLAYEHALLLQPGDANVLNNYAVSRMLAGDLEGAQKLLLQAQAAGANNAKIAGNFQMLAQMKARKPTAPASKASVMAATGAPRSITGSAAGNAPAGAVPQAQTIVMQKIPADTHATAATAPKVGHKLAQSAPPDMRSSADAAPKPEHKLAEGLPPGTRETTGTAKTGYKLGTLQKTATLDVPATKPAAKKDTITAPTKLTAASSSAATSSAAGTGTAKSPVAKTATANWTATKPVTTKTAAANISVAKISTANAAAKTAVTKSAVTKSVATKSAAARPADAKTSPTRTVAANTTKPAATKLAAASSATTGKASASVAAAKSLPALRTADQGE